MSYTYWEGFISTWNKIIGLSPKIAISGWTDPNSIPLYGDQVGKTLSSCFIPEPWWGNDGTSPLHSVVINLNPGVGYDALLHGKVPYSSSYAIDIVNSGVLPINNKWQTVHRAQPIFGSLHRLGVLKSLPCLKNHLSVELIPWHTPGSDANNWNYMKTNIQQVFDNSICFAANESRRIANRKLNSTVILRLCENSTRVLLKELARIGISSTAGKTFTSASGKGKMFEFSFSSIQDVRFFSIWGPRSRNNFPTQADLDDLMKLI